MTNILTEDQIEREVERRMNALDRALMGYDMSQDEYDDQVACVNIWAEQQYKKLQNNNALPHYNIIPIQED